MSVQFDRNSVVGIAPSQKRSNVIRTGILIATAVAQKMWNNAHKKRKKDDGSWCNYIHTTGQVRGDKNKKKQNWLGRD